MVFFCGVRNGVLSFNSSGFIKMVPRTLWDGGMVGHCILSFFVHVCHFLKGKL